MVKYWEKLEKWVENATIADIICHTDSDGLTAASQLVNWLKKQKVGYNIILGSPERLRHNNFWNKIKNDLVFFLDVPADHAEEQLKRLSNRANIIIIDHHKINKDMNGPGIIHYHRKFLGEKRYYPSSKQVYDLFNGIDWMACIGLIGDYGGNPWKEFIETVHKKYGFKPCKDENCFDSPFTKYDHMINSARMAYSDKGCIKALNILINSPTFEEFKNNSEVLEEWAKQVNDYIEHIKSDYKHNKETHKNVTFYELPNPKYKIGSALATIISSETPNKTIIILVKKGYITNINFRRQDGKYDMSELAKKCAGGGGHREAAGATIKTEEIDEFKECVKDQLKKWKQE